MATQADVRRIALALPGATESSTDFAFSVENKGKQKGFAWSWKERIDPKKARVPNPNVLAVRVANEDEKALLLGGDPEKFFTEPHYNGFPAVLVRLAAVTAAELRVLLAQAWACQAPKDAVNAPSTSKSDSKRRPSAVKKTSTRSTSKTSSRRSTTSTSKKASTRRSMSSTSKRTSQEPA